MIFLKNILWGKMALQVARGTPQKSRKSKISFINLTHMSFCLHQSLSSFPETLTTKTTTTTPTIMTTTTTIMTTTTTNTTKTMMIF